MIRATRLVGREREAKALSDALAAAVGGAARTVLVSGDAGVGKSRLLDDLVERARAQGITCLVGHCLNVGGVGLPYLAFSEALAPLGGDLGLAGGGGAEAGQLQLFDAVTSALAGAAERAPVLLVLEDLHWADPSTRDLLGFLLARLRTERLLVAASYRSDDLHRRHPLRPLLAEVARLPTVERLDLAPFDEPAMTAFLRELQGDALPDATVRHILARSEGNAYFAQELLEGEQSGRDVLPPALADVLLARVESLPPAVQHVARIASVAGRRVQHDLLRRVGELPDVELEQALREAVVQHVLVPDGRDSYAFRHALLQEAVYADLLPGERVRYHAAYARAVEQAAGPAALLAHHRVESHDMAGALVASLDAADEAERLRAPAEAWQHLEQALRLWSAAPDAGAAAGGDLTRVTLRAAAKASAAGELHRAVALAQAAVQTVDARTSAELAATVQHRLAHHLLNADQCAPAIEAGLAAVRLAPPGTEAAAWAAATSARAMFYGDRYDEARRLAEQAIASSRALGLTGAEADALITLARVDGATGRAADVSDRLGLAVERAREAGHVPTEMRATYNVALDRYGLGDVEGTLEVCRQALERCAALGVTWSAYGLEIRALLVTAQFVAGDWAGSIRTARLVGDRPPDAMAARLSASSLHALVASGAPDAGDVAHRLEGAWHHDPLIAVFAGGNQAELLRWQDEPAAAVATVNRVLSHLDVQEPSYLAGIWLAAIGLGAAGDLAEQARLLRDEALQARALQTAERLHALAHETARHGGEGGMGPEGRAWLLRADAERARVSAPGDVDAWRRAREAFGYGHVYEQARCDLGAAGALLVRDEREAAQECVRRALATADALGAAPLRAAAASLGRRARLDVGAVATAPSILTPREHEVLALLAEGRTNRQIGERLFMAEKTASVHVSNILAKLGARSRAEAVSLGHRAGLLSTP